MQLEDYFEFEKFDSKFGPIERIRIKGHRIAIEHVIEFYKVGKTGEQIQREMYPSLSLDEVNAAISYYLHNKEAVEDYLQRGEKIEDAWYQEYLKYGPFFLKDRAAEYATPPPPPSDLPTHE